MHQIRFRPGLRPGPRWGSLRRSPRPSSRLGRGTRPPHSQPPRRLWRLGLDASVYPRLCFFSNSTPVPVERSDVCVSRFLSLRVPTISFESLTYVDFRRFWSCLYHCMVIGCGQSTEKPMRRVRTTKLSYKQSAFSGQREQRIHQVHPEDVR